jgi:dienelactone hydrolase
MRIMRAVWLFACLVAPFTAAAANDGPRPVSFVASDNVTIFADYYGGRDAGRPHDLEAALVWAKSSGRSGPVIVWGSSYSAALVFLLAAKHPQDVKALLAFSPGEYLAGASSMRSAAAQLSIPIFVTSAKESGEVAQAKAILDAAPARQKVQFVPHIAGVYGSSTLRSDRNPKGAEENWAAVKAFLASLAP